MPFPTDHLPVYVRQLVARPGEEAAADAVLLARFRTGRDPAAFAALVHRHGPMVLRVCRRLLGSVHDAEDAFQATFLVLARRAGHLQPGRPLAAWLHGVAHRVGLEARGVGLRRRQREGTPAVFDPPDPGADPLARLSAREVLVAVEEEVRALPERYRLPLVLCCLDGHTQEEAAALLGWTPGSVKGRLERGRARLHARLLQRGLTLSAALAVADLARGAGPGAPSTALTTKTLALVAGGPGGPTRPRRSPCWPARPAPARS